MWLSEALIKQAGTELGQAQVKLEILDKVGVKVEVEIVADDGVQLLAWVVGGWCTDIYEIRAKLKLKLNLNLAILTNEEDLVGRRCDASYLAGQ